MFKHKPVKMALFKHGTQSCTFFRGVGSSNFVTVQINVKIQNTIEIYPF